MLAGAPVTLNVTALRREEVPDPTAAPTEDLDAPDDIEAASLDDTGEVEANPIAAAAAALDEVEAAAGTGTATAAVETPPPPAAAPAPPRAPVASGLSKPFIQIGIFSVEANASNTAESLRRAGMVPTIKPGNSAGKAFWRVVVGPPATTTSERAALLKKIKALGFADAYYVTH